MPRDEENQVDMTYLNVGAYEKRGVVHRDYLAHCLRWTHVLKHIKTQEATILDAGCGVLAPMAQTLYVNRRTKVKYLGVDYGKIEPAIEYNGEFQPQFLSDTDISLLTTRFGESLLGSKPDIVTSFEVLEHMQPDRMAASLSTLWHIGHNQTDYLISTPCFNGSAAKNHINEITYEGLGKIFELMHFTVVDHFGTFASISDYKKLISDKFGEPGLELFARQREYYDTNMLSLLWAPFFPEASRNVIWHLRKGNPENPMFISDVFTGEWTPLVLSAVNGAISSGKLGQSEDMDAWSNTFEEIVEHRAIVKAAGLWT